MAKIPGNKPPTSKTPATEAEPTKKNAEAPRAPKTKVKGRVLPKPKPSIGDKFEDAMGKGLDKTLHAMTKAGLAEPIIKKGLKIAGAPGASKDTPPEFLEGIAKSAANILRGEYGCRATKKSFEERSGNFISQALQGSPMGEELKEVDAFHNEAFVREMEQTSGARFSDGNKVEFLIDGPQSFGKRFELIDNAKESISLMTWHIYEDDTGIEMCKRIAAKAREGVEVKVIVDDKIAMRSTGEKTLKVLEEAGAKVIRWSDPENCAVGNHCKLMIIDNEAAVVGGMNPGNVYSHASQTEAVESYDGPKWRDTDMLVEGPAVIDNLELFAAFWNEQVFAFSEVYDPEIYGTVYADKDALLAKVGKPGKSKAAVVNHVPDDDNFKIYSSILKAIDGATKTIDIENAYFLNLPGLEQLLQAALMRGVQVRILTNSKTSVDEPLVSEPIMKSLPELVESGAEVYLKKGDTLHSKFMIVDGSFVSVGSLNLHPRSLFYDAEMAMSLIDPDAAATLGKAFENDLEDKFAQKIDKTADLKVKSTWYNRFIKKYFYDHL
ncbi:MAG: phosphatidylserine/phosphatidylglycerophosphate/cardiolipin synthase family protein [Myxococcota bacterium]|nr:phosphatidylserine/phosphatidylglycerophosphate/cardiolipin synthase family protein [Myxococcota bacterium]